jgi:hypothetical protein
MVDWIDEAITDPPVASDAAVQEAERALRVRFPADFLAIARTRQGAEPVPSGIRLPNDSSTGVLHLLHFEDEPGDSNIVNRIFPVQGVLDKGIIPFAEDVGGDLFCFNYRETPETPGVVYFSVDTGVVPIADSFTDFVGKLCDPFA